MGYELLYTMLIVLIFLIRKCENLFQVDEDSDTANRARMLTSTQAKVKNMKRIVELGL